MPLQVRLLLCVVVVVGSAAYAALVSFDPGLASAVASGYVALLLTVFLTIYIGKRNHDKRPH